MVKRNNRMSLVLVLSFFLLIVTFQFTFLQLQISHGLDQKGEEEIDPSSYRAIDLYTQKEPYDGRGPNQPSDAFAPQENAILYAHVTYRDYPESGKIVAFEVHGPINPVENLSFARTAVTNADGIANVSFRIPWPNGYAEEAVLGVWDVIATIEIAEVVVNDTLTFKVGWIVELLKVETVDFNNMSRIRFMRNKNMYFRLTVRNIAMTDKIATLILDVYDYLNFSLGQIVLQNERILPDITVFFIDDLLIPEWAALGLGVVYANALHVLGEGPWCPEVSATFSIVKMIVHDVAVVSVVPSANEVFPCQRVNISIFVINEGDVSETFNVSCYYDSVSIGMLTVENLPPRTEKALTFSWCTCCVPPGNYTISGEASIVPGEIDIDNNRFVDGVVQVKPSTLPPPAEYALPRWLLAFLFLLAVFVGACLVLLVGLALWSMRERKKEGQIGRQLTASTVKLHEESPFKINKICSACGREFPGVYTFCPYCLTFQGKDY